MLQYISGGEGVVGVTPQTVTLQVKGEAVTYTYTIDEAANSADCTINP